MTDIKRNAAHYYDPTAYKAIMNIEKEREKKMINKELHKGDIIIVETNGRRIYGIIVTNNNLNYNQDQVGMVNISTQTEPAGLACVDVFTNQPAKAICNKVWNIWKSDIVDFMRECTTEEMCAIDKALRWSFGLLEHMTRGANGITPVKPVTPAITENEYKEMKTYIEKLEADNKALGIAYDDITKKNDDLIKNVDKLAAENEYLRMEAASAHETITTFSEIAEDVDKAALETAALTAERDTYKAMYEKLLDKLIGA